MLDSRIAEVVGFWSQAGEAAWFSKNPELDAEIGRRFEQLHHAAARGELSDWAGHWQGSLALLILLDQFPRNLFRGSAHAYATDSLALSIAEQALKAGHDVAADARMRIFFYLPFEHSELLENQDRCVVLCCGLDAETGGNLSEWAHVHRDIIARFGRFPHRNAALGRQSTAEEVAFLAACGFRG